MDNLAGIFLLTAGASFVQRTTGFGFGIFIMTLLPFLMPSYGEATALSGLLALTTSAFTAWKFRKYTDLKRLIPILTVFLVISTPAICFLDKIDDSTLRRVLGGVLIAVSIYFSIFSKRIRFGTALPYQLAAGTFSGIMGGFFGMHGPPAVMYFIASESDKEHYMGMTQAYFTITNLMMTIVRGYKGFLTPTVGKDYILCIGAVAAGTFLGSIVFRHIASGIFRYIVYGYIGISGLIILITS